MKKRVRLYKAQEGTQVQDPQQVQQMLIAQVQSDRAQGVPVEETVYNIYNSFQDMFNNPAEVQEFVTSVYESIDAQEQQVNQQMQEQPQNPGAVDMQDEMAAQAEAGMQMAQMGAQVGNPSYFTGIDAYVPPNYVDMMSNPAFAFGGQKSKYVKQQLDLAKKQMGGEEEPETSGPDEIGHNERNQRLKAFVSGLKQESTLANIKKQAEQQYDQMMTAQDGGQQDYTHYTHGDTDVFHDQMNYLVEAQYGGMTSKQQRQLQRSMNRIPFGAVPTTPVSSIDVRRSGMFGRPKEYTINFASPLQAIGAQGGASAYGYGVDQSTARKTEGKKGTVTIPGTPAENKQEVAKAEEQSGAPTTTGGSNAGTGTGGTGGGSGTGGGNTEEDNTIVETPKPKKGSNYQYIPGKPFVYTPSADGKSWLYQKENDSKWSRVTNEDSLALLNTGQSKSGQLVTLDGKEGYYYRRRNDGSYVKFKGDPANHYEGKAPVKSGDKPMIIKPGDKNYDYLDKNSTWNLKPYIPNVGSGKNFTEDLVSKMYPYTDIPHDYLTGEEKEEHQKDLKIAENMQTLSDAAWDAMSVITGSKNSIGSAIARNMPLTLKPFQTPSGYLNPGQPMMNPGQPMLNPGQGMLNPGTDQYLLKAGQKLLNPPAGTQFRLFAAGGNVMNPEMDMYGNLQRFVYGGGEDPSIPFISQADMNYTNSKDTSDAYFAYGGMTQYQDKGEVDEGSKSYTDQELRDAAEEEKNAGYTVDPAGFSKAINQVNPLYQSDAGFQNVFTGAQNTTNQQQGQGQQMPGFPMTYPGMGMFNSGAMMPWSAGSWNKVTKGPYGANGQSFNMPGAPAGAISKIDVTKSGLMGRPKKYSITYSNPNQLAPKTNTPGTTTPAAKPADAKASSNLSNTEGLGFKAASAVRRGERQMNRQTARGEKEFGTAEQQGQDYYKANPMQKMTTNPLNQMRVTSAANQAPMARMATLPAFGGGKLRGAQYGGYMQDGGTPVDQDQRFEPLPTKSLADLKPLGQQMMMDSRQKISDEANFAPEEYTVDYKVKNAFNVNYPMAIGAKNAGLNKLASFIKGRQEEDFTPLTQEQMTGTMARREEGLYDEYGNYKPDKQSNIGSGLFSKYGGSTVGDELDMTEEEIEEFLANGGELEFI